MKRRVLQCLAAGVALLLVAGVAAPFVHADRYRGRMQSSLSSALGRKVSVDGHVSFSIFSGPALAVDNVTIAETDESREPFAYVEQVRAVPRLYSLWTGQLEFSSLTLDGAHVNLVRGGSATAPSWNFEPLLQPGLLAAFPTIHMRSSRINFVLEGRKSPFYFLDTDLDVAPRSADGSNWSLRFAGEPARSDRPAHGFGAVEATGTWRRTQGDSGVLALDLKLARSEVSDILALVYGRDAGIHGTVAGQAHVAGEMRSLGIEGELRIAQLHGWDQSSPESGVFPLRVSGTLNTPAQRLNLFAQPKARQPQWMLHFIAESYLERPSIQMQFQTNGLPIAPLPALLRNFGANLPEGLQLAGTVNGAVGFSSRDGWSGSAAIPEVALGMRGATPLKLGECSFSLQGSRVSAGPVEVTSGDSAIAEASAEYSTLDGAFQIKLLSRNAPISDLSQRFPAAAIPLLSQMRSGVWSGALIYSQPAAAAGIWQGEGDLRDATAALPALAEPVQILASHLRIQGEDLHLDHMALRTGTVEVGGDYAFTPAAPVPHVFHLVVPRADLPGIETLFHPLLSRGGSLIDRALGRSPAPPWLLGMHATGSLQIDALSVAGVDLSSVGANVSWDGALIRLTNLAMRDGTATLAGVLNIDLNKAQPRYGGSGSWNKLPWKGGLLAGTIAHFETAGSGLETLANLKARGDLTGRELSLTPLGQIDRMSGTYNLMWSGGSLRLGFPSLRLAGNGEVWTGSGSAQGADGEVTLRPAAGRQITLAGSLTEASKDWVER